MTTLEVGSFVRVRNGNVDRSGMDAMVMTAPENGTVGLMFNFDRFGEQQACFFSEGPEAFDIAELDLDSVDR